MATAVKLVRYVSPFGSPASMTPERAEEILADDLKTWGQMEEAGLLDERMLRIGKPRIGDDSFHLTDLPEWITPEPDGEFETIRMLVRRAEHWAKYVGPGPFVVVERNGLFTAMKKALVIDGDDVRWETS